MEFIQFKHFDINIKVSSKANVLMSSLMLSLNRFNVKSHCITSKSILDINDFFHINVYLLFKRYVFLWIAFEFKLKPNEA